MLIGTWIDTVMNLTAFAFIGMLVWVLLRPLARPDTTDETDGRSD